MKLALVSEARTFFQTTIELRPTLQRQRDDGRDNGQSGRQRAVEGLLARLEEQAS